MMRDSKVAMLEKNTPVPGDLIRSLDTHADPDWLFGRAMREEGKVMPASQWVEQHVALVEDLREMNQENAGYSYSRDGMFCMARLSYPFFSGEERYKNMHMEALVQDMPYTTILHPGQDTLPRTQLERRQYMDERMKRVTKCMFLVGGLMENRLALEGVAIDILKNMDNPEDVAIFVLSSCGGEESYRAGADLKKVDWQTELAVTDAGIKRILQLNGKRLDHVKALIGHSKAGLLVEYLLNSGDYEEAAGVELAPVVMGTRISKKKRDQAKWLKKHGIEKPHVIVQQGLYNFLINAALTFPDSELRDRVINMVAPMIARHFVGQNAAYMPEAVAAIVSEIKRNRETVRAQQRSLAGMPMIIEDIDKISNNPRLIIAAGEDETLTSEHQKALKYEVSRRSPRQKGRMIEASLSGRHSPHNVTPEVIMDMSKWLNMQVNYGGEDDVDNLADFLDEANKFNSELRNY